MKCLLLRRCGRYHRCWRMQTSCRTRQKPHWPGLLRFRLLRLARQPAAMHGRKPTKSGKNTQWIKTGGRGGVSAAARRERLEFLVEFAARAGNKDPAGALRSRSFTRFTIRVGLPHLGQSVLLVVSIIFLRSAVLAILAMVQSSPEDVGFSAALVGSGKCGGKFGNGTPKSGASNDHIK